MRFRGLEEAQGTASPFPPGDNTTDDDDGTPDMGSGATQRLLEQDPSGVLLAVVKKGLKEKKNGKGAGKKGDKGGKGGGKKGGPRVCFECGAEDHLANACPVRIERVAAGGPERLPKDDPMTGGKKGGGGKGDKGSWKGYSAKGYTYIPIGRQWKAATGSAGVPFQAPDSGHTRCS